MKIAVINKKGGVGKTPFAFSIAKDLGYFLQSNDKSCIENIYPKKAKILDKVQSIDDCVYDFGGFVAGGVLDILRGCKAIIVPCTPSYNAVLRTVETIEEISHKELEFLNSNLKNRFQNIPMFYFKNSKIVNNAINTGLSFTELYNENALSQRSYQIFFDEYQSLLTKLKG